MTRPGRPDWRWATFPVLAAFVFGALLASFVDRPDTDFAVGVRILLVVAAALCTAHVFVSYVVLPRLRRRRPTASAQKARFEDELVYDNDPAKPPRGKPR